MDPIFIAGQAKERSTAQGARCKEKQSMRYYVQPCTVYLGPSTVCGAARGDHEANDAVQIALDEFDCVQEERLRGASAVLTYPTLLWLRTLLVICI
jgi:hypothetical protein